MEETSHTIPWVLGKAVLAVGYDMGFFWGSIWSEGLGEDRETGRMSVIEETILGAGF